MNTLTDPWAPIDSALARLEHKKRHEAAEARQAQLLETLRAEWNKLTDSERDDLWGGEEPTVFIDLPEFYHWGNRKRNEEAA